MILLTGVDGSLGTFVYKRLDHDNVLCISRNKNNYIKYKHCETGDLCDIKFVDSVFCNYNPSIVIHCASMWNGINHDPDIIHNNLLTTLNLLKLSKNISLFVYVSSSLVKNEISYNLSDSKSFSSYIVSKTDSEMIVQINSFKYEYNFIIWRPFHIVSPAESYIHGRSHLCTNLCYKIIEKKENIDLRELPVNRIHRFTWVEDISEIICSNINNDKQYGLSSYIGNCEKNSVLDMAKCIYFHLGKLTEDDIREVYENTPNNDENIEFCSSTSLLDSVGKFIWMKYGIKR